VSQAQITGRAEFTTYRLLHHGGEVNRVRVRDKVRVRVRVRVRFRVSAICRMW